MTTRRSARLRSRKSVSSPDRENIQVPEITSSNQSEDQSDNEIETAPLIIEEEEERKETLLPQTTEESDASDSDSDEPPEEVAFSKSKETFEEESAAIRGAIRATKKRKVLSASVLNAVVMQSDQEAAIAEKEDTFSSIGTDTNSYAIPRIRAVSLKSLHQPDYNIDHKVIAVNEVVKKPKFSKVKLGPAAEFLVKPS